MTNFGDNDNGVTKFPSAREREALQKARMVHPPAASEPALNVPPLVKALCLANIAVFLVFEFFYNEELMYALSLVPARYFDSTGWSAAAIWSPITHMFLHAGWLHLLINVGTLLAFGAGLEKILGVRRLLVFYIATGFCGELVHVLCYAHSAAPVIGASGAISGLFGGILMMMYDGGMMGQGYRRLLPFVAVWIAISVLFGVFGFPGASGPIAWTVHIGGFVGGLLLYRPVMRLKI